MIDFYNALKTTIQRGEYILEQIEDRINKCWLETKITTDQRDELMDLAGEYAKAEYQIDLVALYTDHEQRIYALEHKDDIDPIEQYPIWYNGYVTPKGGIVRWDVTNDGEYDLCIYNGGRSETAGSVGRINGWYLLDSELNPTHEITRNSDGTYTLTPIEE